MDNLQDALSQMERAFEEAQTLAVGLEREAALARQRAEALRHAVDGLRSYLGAEPKSQATETPGDNTPGEQEPPEAGKKRVRTTKYIADLLWAVDAPLSRDQIVVELGERGVTTHMKNPVGAIQTALTRSVESGLIKMAGDRYVHRDYRKEDDDEPATKELG